MSSSFIRNPHLDGDPFFWPAGKTGALLLHGYTATTAEVRPLAKYLLDRDYTVSGPLLPGHGTTPQDMNRCHWRDWTDAVERSSRDLAAQCERVFVCGESMGGLLSLYLASDHPEIAGVVLYAPALGVAKLSDALTARLMSRFVPYAAKKPGAASDADARWKGYTVNAVPALVQMLELQGQVRKRLPRIHQPLLILQGRLDKSIDLASGDRIIRGVASADKHLVWFERSTHCVILDCEYERAAEMTAGFMANH